MKCIFFAAGFVVLLSASPGFGQSTCGVPAMCVGDRADGDLLEAVAIFPSSNTSQQTIPVFKAPGSSNINSRLRSGLRSAAQMWDNQCSDGQFRPSLDIRGNEMKPADHEGPYLEIKFIENSARPDGEDHLATHSNGLITVWGRCRQGEAGTLAGVDCHTGTHVINFADNDTKNILAHEFGHAFGIGHDGETGQCNSSQNNGIMQSGHRDGRRMLGDYCSMAEFKGCIGPTCPLPSGFDPVQVSGDISGLDSDETAPINFIYRHRGQFYNNQFSLGNESFSVSVPKCADVTINAQVSSKGKQPDPDYREEQDVDASLSGQGFAYSCPNSRTGGSRFSGSSGNSGEQNFGYCFPEGIGPYEGPFIEVLDPGGYGVCDPFWDFCDTLDFPWFWPDYDEPEEIVEVTDGCPPEYSHIEGCESDIGTTGQNVVYIPGGTIDGPVVGFRGEWPRNVGNTMNLQGISASSFGLTGMLFYIDGQLVNPTSSSIGDAFSATLDTSGLGEGVHEVTAVAVDSRPGPNYATIWSQSFSTGSTAAPDIALVKSWNSQPIFNNGLYFYGSYAIDQMPQSRRFLICNDGAINLSLSSVQIPGSAFYRVGTAPQMNLIPGQCTNLRIRFDAAIPGTYQSDLIVRSNDPDEDPFTVLLEGTVIDDGLDRDPPEMFVDAPLWNSNMSGLYRVSGWAVDASGVQSVRFEMDGNPIDLDNYTYGTGRSDVCNVHADIGDPNCPFVGFRGDIDTTQWNNGIHTLTAIALDPRANEKRIDIRVNVHNQAAPQIIAYDAFTGAQDGQLLRHRTTPTGNRPWASNDDAVFHSGKVTALGATNPHGAIAYSPAAYDNRVVEVEARLNPTGSTWAAVGFSTNAVWGWWVDGQIWLWISPNGHFNLMVDGTNHSLIGGAQPTPGQPTNGEHHARLRFDPVNRTVSAWVNGHQVATDAELPTGTTLDIQYAGFSSLHGEHGQTTFDNFRLNLP